MIGRRVLVISAAVVAVALLAWLLLDRDDDGADAGAPQASSAGRLRALSASVGHDLFWAGPPGRGEALELTHQDNGRIYVRYLSGDGTVGDDRAGFTTVGTYPVPGALAALRRDARGPQAVTRDLPEGGFAYLGVDRPTSVYLAWPRSDYEVEVYDPSPKHALDLVLAGKIQPVR